MSGSLLLPAVAGSWYPGDPAELRDLVDGLLAHAPAPPAQPPAALIAPHAGLMYSGGVAAAAFACVPAHRFTRVVLLGPSHYAAFAGAVVPQATAWRTPLGDLPLDLDVELPRRSAPFLREHSLEAELPFLQRRLASVFRAVPVLVGPRSDGADLDAVAHALEPLLDGETLLVVSSDFTHYGAAFGFTPFHDRLPERIGELDRGALRCIEAGDAPAFAAYLEDTGATICGRDAIGVLLRLRAVCLSPCRRTLAYATSGEMTGSFAHSVSYAAVHVAA
ncbi:MAG TPA: AmmeMemoRadiSam system protein B [Candidatus Polarisedimenticolaceae bacterium]|nr:AmmeMemoRadiSam system protein B [Candidatus Polarisedimenticolaceae bacterium]